MPTFIKNTITSETTSLAPDEIPKMKGPAMGLLKNVCSKKPEIDSAAPRSTTAMARGRRMSTTMGLCCCPVMAATTSPTGMLTLPIVMFMTKNTASSISSTTKESL